MNTIKFEILNNLGDTAHHLSNGDIIHYNINGDMLYYYDDKYKTIEKVVYVDAGVPYQYKIEMYGQRFVHSFNEAYPIELDDLFDTLKHQFIRQIYVTGVKYNSGDMLNIDCYGRPTNHIDISNWDVSNVTSMFSGLFVDDDCYGGMDYGIGSMTLGEYIEHDVNKTRLY